MERQTIVQARIRQVHQRLMEVESIESHKDPDRPNRLRLERRLYDLDKEEKITYELVTSEESDPENGMISTVSPIGQALMGREEGDEVKVKTPTGVRNFEIVRVKTIHEKANE